MVYFITYGQGDASKMLDDVNVIRQRDPSDALGAVGTMPQQAVFDPHFEGEVVERQIRSVVITGMGGSALAADMIKVLVGDELRLPLEVVKGYRLPSHVDSSTLVVAISHSGNTEETLECYRQARERGANVSVMSTGGELIRLAEIDGVLRVRIPSGVQPRMSTVYHLRALLKILHQYNLIGSRVYDEIADAAGWLGDWLNEWAAERSEEHNYAKQLAQKTVGKTAVFYGGELTGPIAYKWKISWNETAKNVAFCSQYPEFNHNEFIGWSSHPIDKPFAIFDLQSSFEQPRIAERIELSDRMLSGMRPKANQVSLVGDNLVQQFLWGIALADMTSIYGAILNGVDPTAVDLIEKFKHSLN